MEQQKKTVIDLTYDGRLEMKRLEEIKKEIIKKTKSAKTKSEKSTIITRILYENNLYSVPEELTASLIHRLDLPNRHSDFISALKIARSLEKWPNSMEEVREGARRANLNLKEGTLSRIARQHFGIKEASDITWKKGMKNYANEIKRVLGRNPKDMDEMLIGVIKANLGHLSSKSVTNIASQEFKIKEPRTLFPKGRIKDHISYVYTYFKKGGEFSWELPYSDSEIKVGAALYVKNHLLENLPENKIKEILKKRRVPPELIGKILNLAKKLKESSPSP